VTKLSPQEREVVILVGRDGLTWNTVALKMGLHLGTVRSYVQRIMRKSGVDREPRQAMVELYLREIENEHP
jgi:DNA-binding NarL/FixJ family response regulator